MRKLPSLSLTSLAVSMSSSEEPSGSGTPAACNFLLRSSKAPATLNSSIRDTSDQAARNVASMLASTSRTSVLFTARDSGGFVSGCADVGNRPSWRATSFNLSDSLADSFCSSTEFVAKRHADQSFAPSSDERSWRYHLSLRFFGKASAVSTDNVSNKASSARDRRDEPLSPSPE